MRISRHCGTHLIPVTRINIKVGMGFCKLPKFLVGTARWTHSVHIKNCSDQRQLQKVGLPDGPTLFILRTVVTRQLQKVGLRQIGKVILRTAFNMFFKNFQRSTRMLPDFYSQGPQICPCHSSASLSSLADC